MVCMSRSRITADLPEEIRRAILIHAAERDVSLGDIISEWSAKMIPDHIERAKKFIASQAERPASQKKTRKPS